MHEAAEELQPARYLRAWGAEGGVGFVPGPFWGLSMLEGSELKARGLRFTICRAIATYHLPSSLELAGGEYYQLHSTDEGTEALRGKRDS